VATNLKQGKTEIMVTNLGYKTTKITIELTENQNESVIIELEEDTQSLDEIVISATRTENRISKIPGRVEVITPEKLQLTGYQSIDEILTLLPGVQTARSFGLFSHKSTVSMRGVSGKEQARVLVLVDGIPVNKSDGGSVNWNLISTGEIERIEVVKGPGSALYGGNAMGGIINVVSKRPSKLLVGNVSGNYGTYNTRGGKAYFGGKFENGFYWSTSGMYRTSDGYITQSEADRATNPNIVNSTFDEKLINAKAGFQKTERFSADIDFSIYDDRRETGEKVFQPHGNTTDHDTYSLKATMRGKENLLNWNASLFYQREDYKRVSEWKKDDYTWYDVLSLRSDYGFLSGVSYIWQNHTLSTGFDIRNGAVDASDIYYTSTDQVDNRGKIDFYGIYLQDELSFMEEKVKIIGGLRYDHSRFYDGAFLIHYPSAETVFMDQYQFSGLADQTWGAFSPRLSMQYKPNDRYRIYGGYSRGFRPSVLDDLCRSGRVRGGFKVARPDLKPEYINNFEVGGDYKPVSWARFSASAYYSLGTDFLYYVSTGDSIDMGFGNRPIMIRSNISNVDIYGFEADFTVSPLSYLTFFESYAFNISKIKKYHPESAVANVDLTGKYLSDVPKHSFAVGGLLKTKYVNGGLTGRYTGKMFINDQNVYDDIVLSDQYADVFTVDVKLQREFFNYIHLSYSIQNLFDVQIYESKGAVGPGRFMVLELGVKF
jgi:iron complex outermembrane receptor protein